MEDILGEGAAGIGFAANCSITPANDSCQFRESLVRAVSFARWVAWLRTREIALFSPDDFADAFNFAVAFSTISNVPADEPAILPAFTSPLFLVVLLRFLNLQNK